MSPDLLAQLERYYDTAPRAVARTEDMGPLTLFVAERGWPYYARPRLGAGRVSSEDVVAALQRQRGLGVPQSLEWVHETTPSLSSAAELAGLQVHRCPLLVLGRLTPPARIAGYDVRVVAHHDPSLPQLRAAIAVGFGHGGTSRGTASTEDRDAMLRLGDPDREHHAVALMQAGLLRVVGAFGPDGAVGGGSHSPRDGVTEVTGVAVLPAVRRRGLAALITARLAQDAEASGVRTVFCSADSADVARVYQRIGFRRVGTACIAAPPPAG